MNSGPQFTAARQASGPLLDIVARAAAAHANGRAGEAEFNCRLVLAADRRQFDALHLLGIIEFERGKFESACQFFRQATKANPQSANAFCNLGLALQELGKSQEAITSFERALRIEPDHMLALNNRGHLLWRLKRPEEALASLDRALEIDPNHVDALCNRGNVLVELSRFEEALAAYERALAIRPQDATILNNRANVLWALNRRDEAMASYDQAAGIAPGDLSILKDRGTALMYSGRVKEALADFERALGIVPENIYFLYKKGTALVEMDRHEEALACFDQALSIDPNYVDALGNRGNALAALERAGEAIASFDKALSIRPETPEAHWNRGLALLRMGDFEQGWEEFEWRWKTFEYAAEHHEYEQPLWLGTQSLEDKTILLHFEGGYGDTIQFVRYVPLVAALGAKVFVQVRPALKSLLAQVDGADKVFATDEQLPAFDFRCPLMSLPGVFRTNLDTIPAQIPYLSASEERIAAWRARLPERRKPRVGVAWAGNPKFLQDRTRSIGLGRMVPLFAESGIDFFSLQKELRPGDLEILQAHPEVTHLGEAIETFDDTAALLSDFDLLISSDTSVVHLAGALGRPVWILLERVPDWRWLMDRTDCPWYPSARLFRQVTLGDWGGVIDLVRSELRLHFPK